MDKDREEGGLLERLIEYSAQDHVPFHMPGHKRHPGGMPDPFTIDITEIDGFDDLHHPEGILQEIQDEAAAFYGTKQTHFLVNGSTSGILAALGTFCVPERHPQVILARNSHRSAYHGLYLNRAEAVFVYPHSDPASVRGDLYGGRILPEDVEKALQENPDAAAVFVTSPTYDGIVSDIRRIAEITHAYGTVLIVDEAHGAHFGLHPGLPETAVRLSADIVIQSLHKTLPSLTQTAVLHVCSDRVDTRRLRRCLSIYQSSSPSYVLLASMDRCVRLMRRHGREIYENILQELSDLRKQAETLRYVRLLETDDPTRIAVCTSGRLSGRQICDTLKQTYHIEPELDAPAFALCLVGAGDDAKSLRRLSAALAGLDRMLADRVPEKDDCRSHSCEWKSEQVMPLYAAWDSPAAWQPLAKSLGRIAVDFIYIYPPGVPLLVPGERIDERTAEAIEAYDRAGYTLHGPVRENGEWLIRSVI